MYQGTNSHNSVATLFFLKLIKVQKYFFNYKTLSLSFPLPAKKCSGSTHIEHDWKKKRASSGNSMLLF